MSRNLYLFNRPVTRMLQRSTIQLLRFPFSFFLMPVYWFALSVTAVIDIPKALPVFVILHLLIYPSSNGYNSYMDRDTESIGGVEHPMEPQRELFVVSVIMDILAIGLSLLVSDLFALFMIIYICCSRLYSYRGVRLKKYPVIGYLTVILNQGGLVFLAVVIGIGGTVNHAWLPAIASCLLIGGFYPITQVYQHQSDERDGVKTISMLLGIRGTFVFCALMYLGAFALLFLYYRERNQLNLFLVLQLFFLPVLACFFNWVWKVWRDERLADFRHTMRMNWLASGSTNLAFITLTLLQHFG